MSTGKENKKMNPDGDNLINKNSKANPDQARKFDKNDSQATNVDPLKPHFERSDMNANKEQRAGSGGSGKTSDKNPGNR